MKICLRSAARISAERLISVQPDEQTEIDMETHMAVNMGDKSVYIYRPSGPRVARSPKVQCMAVTVSLDFTP